MDADFLKQLDQDLTDVGRDSLWKREVGGRTVWLSPVPWQGQAHVNETMADESLGVNFAYEVKRLTLSYAIVGIDEHDLRSYRDAGLIFPVTGRDGKTIKVVLQKYVYEKMGSWGDPWIDATFDVFADLMESHKSQNLEKIKFENQKPPIEELTELELQAGKLREELGMPQMTEVGSEAASAAAELKDDPSWDPRKVAHRGEAAVPGDVKDPELQFDPFEKVSEEPVAQTTTAPQPTASPAPAPAPEPLPQPVQSIPVPVPPAKNQTPIQRALAAKEASRPVADILDGVDHTRPKGAGPVSSVDNPFPAQPSVEVGVVESQAERKVVDPPRVNDSAKSQSQNPRFHKSG